MAGLRVRHFLCLQPYIILDLSCFRAIIKAWIKEKTMFNIRCRVSGGVTGTRESLLKASGEVAMFETFEDAETHAAHLNKEMNGGFGTATFSYTVIPA